MIIKLSGFNGANRALYPMLLPDSVGVESLNQNPGRGDLRPWNAPLNVAVVPGGRQTVHRMGRDVVSDTEYWLSWPSVVHAVVAGNAADSAERTYYTGDGIPKWTNTTLALAATPYPTAWRALGVPAPASACTLSASGGVSTLSEVRYYTYTYVTDIGEESAPATPSLAITCKPDDTITIDGFAIVPGGSYGITTMRIYRTQSGTVGDASFFFLREVADSTVSSSDDGRALGEVLPTVTWLMPPTDLKWLTGLWNGMMAGISGRAIRFCEAYTHYAWPIAYEILPTNAQPVALVSYGQVLVMLTDGKPSVITGGTPDAMDEQPVEFAQACVSPPSAVGLGHGVAWASPDGLAYLGSGGARLLTRGLMTREDWQAINPTSIIGCMREGMYLGFYTVLGVRKGFMIDPLNPQGLYFMDFGVDAVYHDALRDELFVLDGINIQKWDAGTAKTVSFTGKQHRMPKPTQAFACAQVVSDAYPVTFQLYADGVLKHTETVASSKAFRLPGGYYADNFQQAVSGVNAIQGAVMAHSMKELAQT